MAEAKKRVCFKNKKACTDGTMYISWCNDYIGNAMWPYLIFGKINKENCKYLKISYERSRKLFSKIKKPGKSSNKL